MIQYIEARYSMRKMTGNTQDKFSHEDGGVGPSAHYSEYANREISVQRTAHVFPSSSFSFHLNYTFHAGDMPG